MPDPTPDIAVPVDRRILDQLARTARAQLSWTASARLLADIAGWWLLALGFWSTLRALAAPIEIYDEGIVLTNALAILHGKLPYRDFYSNYPPGLFWLLAAVWRVSGISAVTERVLGVAVHLGIALLAGRIVARGVRRRFSALSAAAVLWWLVDLKAEPFAWLCALLASLVFVELFFAALARDRRLLYGVSGAAFTAISCFRHDLFVYECIAFAAVLALWGALRRRLPWRGRERQAIAFAVGAAVPLLAIWVPTLLTGGLKSVVSDLYLDQVRHVQPARWLPAPKIARMLELAHFPWRLPVFLEDPAAGAYAEDVWAPLVGALAVLATRRARGDWRVPLVLSGLCVAVMPQALQRSDIIHVEFCVAACVASGFALGEALALRLPGPAKHVAIALVAAVAFGPMHSRLHEARWTPEPTLPHGPPPYNGLQETNPFHAEVIAFIASNSGPDEPIFIGNAQHRLLLINEVELYYLSDRTGASRYTQFDPNMTNRREVQERIARELGEKNTRVAVLSDCCFGWEPNESARPGDSFLDEYLLKHFRLVKRAGPYLLLLRSSPG